MTDRSRGRERHQAGAASDVEDTLAPLQIGEREEALARRRQLLRPVPFVVQCRFVPAER